MTTPSTEKTAEIRELARLYLNAVTERDQAEAKRSAAASAALEAERALIAIPLDEPIAVSFGHAIVNVVGGNVFVTQAINGLDGQAAGQVNGPANGPPPAPAKDPSALDEALQRVAAVTPIKKRDPLPPVELPRGVRTYLTERRRKP